MNLDGCSSSRAHMHVRVGVHETKAFVSGGTQDNFFLFSAYKNRYGHGRMAVVAATALVMAGQTMAGFFYSQLAQLGAICTHLMCVLVPRLNSGRLAVYSCDRAHGNLQV